MQIFFFFVIKVFFHIKNNLILSNQALKLLSVAASLTFCGNSFQRGITLFRKNSFLDVHIFAGSLRKNIPPLLKFLAAGPSVSPWTFFSGRFFPFNLVRAIYDFIEFYKIPPFSPRFKSR